MLRNYLSAAFGDIGRNGAYAAITILGLAVSFAAAILIDVQPTVVVKETGVRFLGEPGGGRGSDGDLGTVVARLGRQWATHPAPLQDHRRRP